MTDPNFLHAGDHVHLGPGISGVRRTNPALDLHELPRIDIVLLSHYHGYASSISLVLVWCFDTSNNGCSIGVLGDSNPSGQARWVG
jgi:hypothetical protein